MHIRHATPIPRISIAAQVTIPAGAPDAMVVNIGSEIVLIQPLGRKGDAS